MKKHFLFSLLIFLSLFFVGCGKIQDSDFSQDSTDVSVDTPVLDTSPTPEITPEPTPAPDLDTEELGGEILEQEYYDLAKNLSEKYGMNIKIADQCRIYYDVVTIEPSYNLEKILSALKILETAISNYPEGFFEQLYFDSYRTIEVNLTSTITSNDDIDGYFPTAYIIYENDTIVLILNIDMDAEILEQNFYHESSHIIDKVLNHHSLRRDDALYSEESWWVLNPEEFIALNPCFGGYYESYDIMPMEYFQEEFTSYFVSDYGKSFPTEDRATVFETAMMGNARFFACNAPLYEKLKFYCDCIRDTFDTTGWPEQTRWERTLADAHS